MTEAEKQERYSLWWDNSYRRHTFPGNEWDRREVQRLGLGVSIPEVPRHQPPEPVSLAGKPFHGSVSQVMMDSAQTAHERLLEKIEHSGPEWLQRRLDLEQSQRWATKLSLIHI